MAGRLVKCAGLEDQLQAGFEMSFERERAVDQPNRFAQNATERQCRRQ